MRCFATPKSACIFRFLVNFLVNNIHWIFTCLLVEWFGLQKNLWMTIFQWFTFFRSWINRIQSNFGFWKLRLASKSGALLNRRWMRFQQNQIELSKFKTRNRVRISELEIGFEYAWVMCWTGHQMSCGMEKMKKLKSIFRKLNGM